MYSLNRAQIIGYLTQDPEIRKTPQDQSVGDLNIMSKYWFTTNDGQSQQGTSFHSVVVWRGLADVCGQYLRRGSQVYISGRLQTDSWEDDKGQKKSKTRLVADEMIMLDSRNPITDVPEDSPAHGFLNKAEVIGNATRDPEMRTTPQGQVVTTIGIATNYSWKDKNSGEEKEVTEFHNVVFWGKLAENVGKYVQKGRKMYVCGRLQTRNWEAPTGEKRYTTEIVAENFSVLGTKISSLPQSEGGEMSPGRNEKVAAGNETVTADMSPQINYQSNVRPEDLPF